MTKQPLSAPLFLALVLAATGIPAPAQESDTSQSWIFTGSYPYIYTNQDQEWYYVYQSSLPVYRFSTESRTSLFDDIDLTAAWPDSIPEFRLQSPDSAATLTVSEAQCENCDGSYLVTIEAPAPETGSESGTVTREYLAAIVDHADEEANRVHLSLTLRQEGRGVEQDRDLAMSLILRFSDAQSGRYELVTAPPLAFIAVVPPPPLEHFSNVVKGDFALVDTGS